MADILAENREKNVSDKELAIQFKNELDKIPVLNVPSNSYGKEESGVWQVIIGRQFAASVTFDAKYIFYFQIEESRKYFLVFRS